MPARIRKLVVQVDETRIESGRPIDPPTRKALAMAVIENPYAGGYAENLDELIAIGEELGGLLGQKCVQALGIAPGAAHSYGKAAIVGEAGELEHAAAILHPKLGAPLRRAVEKGAALVPSSKKRGGLGTAIDVPLGHKDAAFVRSHFDAMEARIGDAPRPNEILVAVVVTDSGRPLSRVGERPGRRVAGDHRRRRWRRSPPGHAGRQDDRPRARGAGAVTPPVGGRLALLDRADARRHPRRHVRDRRGRRHQRRAVRRRPCSLPDDPAARTSGSSPLTGSARHDEAAASVGAARMTASPRSLACPDPAARHDRRCVGGGQLGRYFVMAARTMGYRTMVLEPDPRVRRPAPAADDPSRAPRTTTPTALAVHRIAECAVGHHRVREPAGGCARGPSQRSTLVRPSPSMRSR